MSESGKSLRPYQESAVSAMIAAAGTGGIVLCATGSGKTFMCAELFRRLTGNGLMIVDELTLLAQAQKEIADYIQEKVGTAGKSKFEPQRITIATVQTLHKHRQKPVFRKWFQKLDIVVIDEIHVALNKRNIDVVQQVGPKAVFGLTATLEMQKPHVAMPACALAGPVIYEYPIQRGITEGFLSRTIILRIEFQDLLHGPAKGYFTKVNGKKTFVAGWTPSAEYRYRIVRNRARNSLIEAAVREAVRRGNRVILLLERLAHLRMLSRRLVDIEHRTLSGEVDSTLRTEAMRLMDAGELPLIIANRVFGKGVNVKTVSVVIDATGLPGRNAAMQRLGRGSRKSAGKTGLIYIDIADRGNKFAGAAQSRKQALKEFPAIEVRREEIEKGFNLAKAALEEKICHSLEHA